MERGLVIAIDGPAGAGKSTVAKLLALRLSLRYLDTGAMYRALALKAQRQGLTADEGEAAAHLMSTTTIEFGKGTPAPVLLDGEDVSGLIRTPEISQLASALSAHTPVRQALVPLQQAIVARGDVVLEGRDTTTVVAPHAQVKVFLTASLEERAERRTRELAGRGETVDYGSVRQEVSSRDHRDITRDDSPLAVASGAKVIETAGLTPDEVADRIARLVAV